MKQLRLTLLFLSLLMLFVHPAQAQSGSPLVMVITVDNAISPPVLEYIQRGIGIAEQRNADLLVLQLNTEGGDLLVTLGIIQAIRSSTVPVVVYVTPQNAIAGSAGALITMAGQVSAMAPETAIGASSPISGSGGNLDSDSRAKAVEISKAAIRPLVEPRGQEALQIAEAMIDTAKAVTAQEALDVNLIDFIAPNLDNLLNQMNGFDVNMAAGTRTLHTANAGVETIEATLIEQLLTMLTNPNIVFLLLNLGILAIFIEIASPGGWVAGFIGVVCVLLSTYGLGVLPVNWFGILFLIVSFVLFIIDIKAATHGALTAAGIGSFIVGALVLFNSPGTPQFQRVSVPLVVAMALLTGVLFAIVVGFAIRALHIPAHMGQESITGKIGRTTTAFDPDGQVQLGSELWSAAAVDGSDAIRKGDKVEVVSVEGLRLKVRKVN